MKLINSQKNCCQTKRLNLSSIPKSDYRVVEAMFDLTVRCNLNCTYCFKRKGKKNMTLRVAQDALIWLIYASGSERQIGIQFMGGEPFLRLDIMKKLIPFGKERSKAHGKIISFGVTTNTTLVTKNVVDFARESGMNFHLSIDGIPDVQNFNRPLSGGGMSSPLIEAAIPSILKEQPGVMARACLAPENAKHLLRSFRYFRNLGFTTIGFFPCETDKWTNKQLVEYEEQLSLLGNDYIENLNSGINVRLYPLERWFLAPSRDCRGVSPCGSGRGLVLIDTDGGIWPCSRFSSFDKDTWQLGNIYDSYYESRRMPFIEGCSEKSFYPHCRSCDAVKICEGGCLAENLDISGNIHLMHPNDCELNLILSRVAKGVHDILYYDKNPIFMQNFYSHKPQDMDVSGTNHL